MRVEASVWEFTHYSRRRRLPWSPTCFASLFFFSFFFSCFFVLRHTIPAESVALFCFSFLLFFFFFLCFFFSLGTPFQQKALPWSSTTGWSHRFCVHVCVCMCVHVCVCACVCARVCAHVHVHVHMHVHVHVHVHVCMRKCMCMCMYDFGVWVLGLGKEKRRILGRKRQRKGGGGERDTREGERREGGREGGRERHTDAITSPRRWSTLPSNPIPPYTLPPFPLSAPRPPTRALVAASPAPSRHT